VKGLVRRLRPRLGVGPQIVAIVLVIGLAGAMAIEPTRQLLEQRDRIRGLQADLDGVRMANRGLADRIRRLRDPDYLEQEARALGLVRRGERSFVVLPPSRRATERRDRRRARAAAPSVPQAPANFLERALKFMGLG
jgi:cell division protein FtsB